MKRRFLKFYRFNALIILLAAAAALLTVLKLQTFPQMQFLVVLVLVFFYLTWAITYHLLDKSLTLEVMLEYILTALLALVVAYGVLV